MQLHWLSAAEGLSEIGRGLLDPADWARACLERAQAREPEIGAWSWLDHETVLSAQLRSGPLGGVPVGIKDVILTADMPTGYNSPQYEDFRPAVDAACVSVLRSAGALIFGKTATVEFAATGRIPNTRNPRDLRRTPGGSSSGSAAAVADGHVPLALGTQTGGSILRPAAYCGVYGFKPSWGVVSVEGVKAFAPSLDTVGWFARTPEDLELVFDLFAAGSTAEPALDLRGARIGLYRSPAWPMALDATRTAMDRAEALLTRQGARLAPLELPPRFGSLLDLHLTTMESEAASSFLAQHRTDSSALAPSIRAYVERAGDLPPCKRRAAYALAAACREEFDAAAAAFDVVLTPSVPGEAPAGLHSTGSFAFNALWSLLHVPAVNVPGLATASGLPVGVTLTAPRFEDRRVLSAARAIGPVFGSSQHPGAAGDFA